jgi:hypothetical protein
MRSQIEAVAFVSAMEDYAWMSVSPCVRPEQILEWRPNTTFCVCDIEAMVLPTFLVLPIARTSAHRGYAVRRLRHLFQRL